MGAWVEGSMIGTWNCLELSFFLFLVKDGMLYSSLDVVFSKTLIYLVQPVSTDWRSTRGPEFFGVSMRDTPFIPLLITLLKGLSKAFMQ